MNIITVFLIFYFSIPNFCYGSAILNNKGLYNAEDNIVVLGSENFRENVFNQKHAVVVEFYSSWCGYCQRFAPIWKNFAESIELWNDIVRIAAIDCANELNFDLCKEFEILSYPQLKYFHVGYEDFEGQIGQNMIKNFDINLMRQTLIRQLMQDHKEGHRGENWPNLSYYKENSVEAILNDSPNITEYVFVIFETDNSTNVGHEVMLDLHNNKNIAILVDNGESTMAEALEIKQRPGLVAITKYYEVRVLILEDISREGIKDTIKSFIKSYNVDSTSTLSTEVTTTEIVNEDHSTTELIPTDKISTDVVYQDDLLTAFRYTIYREIPRNNVIDGKKLLSLKRYLRVLAKYLNINRNLRTILNNLKYEINQVKKEIPGSTFLSLVREQDKDQLLFSSNKWVGCAGSQPGFRGFPCGLWTLFHHLTVSATFDKNADPREVLQAMHGYIKHFFGCEDCSKHFQEMASRNKIWNVTSPDEAVYWLWSAHNEVNNRLSGDYTEDPLHPKIQFPSSQNCPACLGINGWNNVSVLSYLKKIYTKVVGNQETDQEESRSEIIQQKDCFSRKMILCLVKLYKDDRGLFPESHADDAPVTQITLRANDDVENKKCYERWQHCRSLWLSLIQKDNNMESIKINEPYISIEHSGSRMAK